MIRIPHYETSYFLFSNFSSHAILYKGELYPTVEHAFQAQKFLDKKIREDIRNATSSFVAFTLGRNSPGKRSDWQEIKQNIMYDLLKAKVMQHDEVKEKLLKTGDEEIIEENPNDDYWGSGKEGNGENHMGKILMRVREGLKSKSL